MKLQLIKIKPKIQPKISFAALVTAFLFFSFCNAFSQFLYTEEIKITFLDTESFDESVLISALGMNESEIYDPQVLGDNIYKLQKFYFDNGYFDAKIDTAVKYDLPEEEVYINILVKENKHYKIDALIYSGLDSLPDKIQKLLNKNKKIREGDFYNKTDIINQTNIIADLLQNNGYMNARSKADSGTIVKKIQTDSAFKISVTLRFEGTDSIFYFGKTSIEITDNIYGVEKELLEEEISYNEGEIYSKEKMLETEKNMSGIPIVQSTRISPDEIINSKVNFKAEVLLNDKTEIGPFARATVIDNVFYAGGGVQYINKYFLSGGKVFNLSADGLINSLDVNRLEFSASVTQPHVFNSNSYLVDKITLGLYNVENSKNYYIGNLISYVQAFTDFTFYNNASLDLTFELLRSDYSDFADPSQTVFNSLLSTTFVHDNTNNVFSPSKGFYHSITLGSAGLFPKILINTFEPNLFYSQYLKLFTSNNFYFDLARDQGRSVFATKILVGDIIEYGSGDRVIPLPPFYKFYSGGSTSLRGWGAKENGILTNTMDGGDFLIEGSFELRQKLFPGSEDFKKNISGAVFIDYGNVWPTDEDFRFNQIAVAVGFGLRYNVFIGPVRVDFGFKLYDPTTGSNAWLINDFSNIFSEKFVIHFGIGEAF